MNGSRRALTALLSLYSYASIVRCLVIVTVQNAIAVNRLARMMGAVEMPETAGMLAGYERARREQGKP